MRRHTLLRFVLSRFTGISVGEIKLSRDGYGRPTLMSQERDFNTSYTKGFTAVAVANGGRVGVDIETIRGGIDYVSVANIFFHPEEVATLTALSAVDQAREFFAIWTAKEAIAKCEGSGITARFSSLRSGEPSNDSNEWHAMELAFYRPKEFCICVARTRRNPVHVWLVDGSSESSLDESRISLPDAIERVQEISLTDIVNRP